MQNRLFPENHQQPVTITQKMPTKPKKGTINYDQYYIDYKSVDYIVKQCSNQNKKTHSSDIILINNEISNSLPCSSLFEFANSLDQFHTQLDKLTNQWFYGKMGAKSSDNTRIMCGYTIIWRFYRNIESIIHRFNHFITNVTKDNNINAIELPNDLQSFCLETINNLSTKQISINFFNSIWKNAVIKAKTQRFYQDIIQRTIQLQSSINNFLLNAPTSFSFPLIKNRIQGILENSEDLLKSNSLFFDIATEEKLEQQYLYCNNEINRLETEWNFLTKTYIESPIDDNKNSSFKENQENIPLEKSNISLLDETSIHKKSTIPISKSESLNSIVKNEEILVTTSSITYNIVNEIQKNLERIDSLAIAMQQPWDETTLLPDTLRSIKKFIEVSCKKYNKIPDDKKKQFEQNYLNELLKDTEILCKVTENFINTIANPNNDTAKQLLTISLEELNERIKKANQSIERKQHGYNMLALGIGLIVLASVIIIASTLLCLGTPAVLLTFLPCVIPLIYSATALGAGIVMGGAGIGLTKYGHTLFQQPTLPRYYTKELEIVSQKAKVNTV